MVTLIECVMAWEEIGLDRGHNPLVGLLPKSLKAKLLECQRNEGCERDADHHGVCIVPKGPNGPWEVLLDGWRRKTYDPEAFTGGALRMLDPETRKGITE